MGQYQPYLSRHFLASQAECLATIPFPPGVSTDEGNGIKDHNILACCGWNEDIGVRLLQLTCDRP